MTRPEERAKQEWDEGKKWTDESFTEVKCNESQSLPSTFSTNLPVAFSDSARCLS